MKTGMSVDDLQNGWRMRTGVQDQKSEWNPGGSSVTVMGRTMNCDNPSTHSTDENTEGKLGGKTPTGSTHALSISLSVPLSPPPMAREGVLGRMAFVQLRAPPGYFRQAKVWGVGGRCPPHPRAISVRARRARKQRKLSKATPEMLQAEHWSVGSVVSECPECPNTLGMINPRQ